MESKGPLDGLLERDDELRRLDRALDHANEGRGCVVLIEGPAGIGKSALLAYATHCAEQRGFLILEGAGDELEQSLPFGVAIDLIAEPAARRKQEDPAFVSGAAGLAMPLLERGPASPPAADPASAFPHLHGLYWLVAGLAERKPLLIAVDDSHWCDQLTLRFLLYLAKRAEALSLAIVLTTRSGDPVSAEVAAVLAGLREQSIAKTISVEPLSELAVHELVLQQRPDADDSMRSAFYDATRGNPFLLRELLAAGRDGAVAEAADVAELRPEAIRGTILTRLGRLGEDVRSFAQAVAVLRPSAERTLAGRLAGMDDDAAVDAADALIGAEILAPAEPLDFAHPVIGEAVYADIPAEQRRHKHIGAARLLLQAGASPESIAAHLLAGGPVDETWATSALREAAALTIARGDPAMAVALLRRALDTGEQGDPAMLLDLGRAEIAAADSAAIEHLEAASIAAQDELQAVAALELGKARWVFGDLRGAFEGLSAGLEHVPTGQGGVLEAEFLMYSASAGRTSPPLVDAVAELLAIPRADDGAVPTPAEVARRSLRAFDAVLRGDREAAIAGVEWILSLDREGAVLPTTLLSFTGLTLAFLGRYGQGRELTSRGLQEAMRHGSLLEIASCLEARICASWGRGDVNSCLADVEMILALNEEGWERATVPLRVCAAEMYLERDDADAARQVLGPAEEVESRLPGTVGWLWLPYGRALLAAAGQDWEASMDQALAAGARLIEIQAPSPDYMAWRSLAARAAERLGDRARALALAEEELELARPIDSPKATGVALTCLGAIRGGEEGLDLLHEGVDTLDRSEAELASARARLELGMALRRARRAREARRPLREALETARRLGSFQLADLALGELRAAGGRPRHLALSGVESLTPAERRVAEMAAQGLSNREIAEALFVTRRTVETHLTHTYSKLDISDRDALPEVLGASGSRESVPA